MIDKSSNKNRMRSSADTLSLLVKEKDRQLSAEDPFEESAWSLDHWFPQNPKDDDGKKMNEAKKQKLKNDRFDDATERDISTPYLHSIGNLIYATRKGNSDFGNSLPPEKIKMIDDPTTLNSQPHIKTFVDENKKAYMVTDPGEVEELKRGQLLSEDDYFSKVEEYKEKFTAMIVDAHEHWNATIVEQRAKKLSKYCYTHIWKFKPSEQPKVTIIPEVKK